MIIRTRRPTPGSFVALALLVTSSPAVADTFHFQIHSPTGSATSGGTFSIMSTSTPAPFSTASASYSTGSTMASIGDALENAFESANPGLQMTTSTGTSSATLAISAHANPFNPLSHSYRFGRSPSVGVRTWTDHWTPGKTWRFAFLKEDEGTSEEPFMMQFHLLDLHGDSVYDTSFVEVDDALTNAEYQDLVESAFAGLSGEGGFETFEGEDGLLYFGNNAVHAMTGGGIGYTILNAPLDGGSTFGINTIPTPAGVVVVGMGGVLTIVRRRR